MPPVYVVLTSTGVVVGVLSCPRAADDLAYNEAVARDEETGDGVQLKPRSRLTSEWAGASLRCLRSPCGFAACERNPTYEFREDPQRY